MCCCYFTGQGDHEFSAWPQYRGAVQFNNGWPGPGAALPGETLGRPKSIGRQLAEPWVSAIGGAAAKMEACRFSGYSDLDARTTHCLLGDSGELALNVNSRIRLVDTSLSLFERLNQNEGWDQLAAIYSPLLKVWLQKYDVQAADQEDLVQEVLLTVASQIHTFEHNGRQGAFRTWLKSILVNRLRHFWRSRRRQPEARSDSEMDRRLAELADSASEVSRIWDAEHDRHLIRQLLTLIEPHFSPKTWQAFVQQAIQGKRGDAVAADLGMSTNAVFIAKSRVFRRLRQEAGSLTGDSSDFFRKS